MSNYKISKQFGNHGIIELKFRDSQIISRFIEQFGHGHFGLCGAAERPQEILYFKISKFLDRNFFFENLEITNTGIWTWINTPKKLFLNFFLRFLGDLVPVLKVKRTNFFAFSTGTKCQEIEEKIPKIFPETLLFTLFDG
jgi:hypothetical protein